MTAHPINYLVLFCIGCFGLWISIPYGLAFSIKPFWICVTIILGSTFSTSVVYILGKRVKQLILSKRGKSLTAKSEKKMVRYLEKYGIEGLGLLLPGVFGPALGMAIGITMVTSVRKLYLWSLLGNVIWSVILVAIVALGLYTFNSM